MSSAAVVIGALRVNIFFLCTKLVDMRWGVPVETTDDHLATALCQQEITNCQKLSTGPNFVVSQTLQNISSD